MTTTHGYTNDTWVTIVSDEDYLLQVKGKKPIELVAGTLPTDIHTKGVTLNPGDAITSQMLAGTLHIHSAVENTVGEYTVAV